MYSAEINQLVKTLRSYKSKVKVIMPDDFDLNIFPCVKIRDDISQFGYLSSFTLDCNSNGVNFYGFNKIVNEQAIFDINIKDFLVIADSALDPIVIAKDCNLYWSIHGGEYEFKKIATSLENFFATLTVFATFYFGNFKRNIRNEDYAIDWDKYKIIKNAIIDNGTDEDIADNFLNCMLCI